MTTMASGKRRLSELLLLLLLSSSCLFQSVSALPTFVPNCTLAGPHLSSTCSMALVMAVCSLQLVELHIPHRFTIHYSMSLYRE
jgi:hypothetical protein